MENSYEVRTCGQHPGRMSRVGVGGGTFLCLLCFSCFREFWTFSEHLKYNYFHGGGFPPAIREIFLNPSLTSCQKWSVIKSWTQLVWTRRRSFQINWVFVVIIFPWHHQYKECINYLSKDVTQLLSFHNYQPGHSKNMNNSQAKHRKLFTNNSIRSSRKAFIFLTR